MSVLSGVAEPSAANARLERSRSNRVMWLATICFTLLFAVWLQFGVLSVPIREQLGLSLGQVAWVLAVASLNGSIWRLITGIMADRWGGRKVMVALMLLTVPFCVAAAFVNSYGALLLVAFLVGIAGNSFTIGVSWVSAWTESSRQGLALGVFGAGNVGASITKMIGPWLLAVLPAAGLFGIVPDGAWRNIPLIYAALVLVMALITWWAAPLPEKKPTAGVPLRDQLRPLKELRVWRFSLYYVVVFGAYVALSGWLPTFYKETFHASLGVASLCAALYIFPASLLRPLGGWMSDKWGARPVMYISLTGIVILCSLMVLVDSIVPFTILLFVVGITMGIGKAAVYKHIPVYYPKDVGAVGGLVGMLGGLGAVALPPIFAYVRDGMHLSMEAATFGTLGVVALIALIWMHLAIQSDKRRGAAMAGHLPTGQAS